MTAHAALAARFDPLAGHLVWTGRVRSPCRRGTRMVIRTPHGSGPAEATEHDPWGNTRVSGVDRPPFPVELLDARRDGVTGQPGSVIRTTATTAAASPATCAPTSRSRSSTWASSTVLTG